MPVDTRRLWRKPVRVYADTSVFGGIFDQEFKRGSRLFLEQVKQERFQLVVSALVREEVDEAPAHIRALFAGYAPLAETCEISEESVSLRSAYIEAGIVTQKSLADALHVALASVNDCVMIVSWNFRHIVHVEKASAYNAVNLSLGYRPLVICSPPEVTRYEEETL